MALVERLIMDISITSKRQSYNLWRQGLFGNKGGDWATVEDLRKSRFRGTVAIRYCGFAHGGIFIKDLQIQQVEPTLAKLHEQGWSLSDFYILEQMSPDIVTYRINGELLNTPDGLALYYSTDNALMRDALVKSGRQVWGLRTMLVLRHFLNPTDFEELMTLLDHFPGHVIEFSSFSRSVGLIPHRQMIVWEVRLY